MMFEIRFTDLALSGLVKLAKSEPKVYQKALRFIEELKEHPKMGTGHPEPLKGQPEGRWSRELSKKHRLVYRILDTEIVVLVLSSYGHYDDK
jgi:toxin YoeB